MNNKRKIIYLSIIIVCICGLIIFAIYLYRTNSQKKDTFIIGMSQANLYEPWRISMNKEIQEEVKKHSNIKIIFKDAGGDVEKQREDIEDLMNFGADLLIVSINNSKELTPTVRKAYESLPVILLDRAVDGYDYTLYIGADTRSIGVQAGELIANLAGNNKANVIEVQGILDSSTDKEITDGFKEAISNYKNIAIDRTIVGNWQKNETEDKLEEILKDDKDVNIIFAHSDYMALGAYYATVSTNSKNIKIIGVDGLEGPQGGIDLVRNGILQGTFTCKTGGKEAVDYAIKILNKKDDIPKKVLLKCNKITKDILSN
ncbi:substrate-binding domain-containing protein [Clostridium beijerinckii]|uniref:Substrate-binding domain-containing protein n=2 Tax=Clostridium beijerinckii TaxID=1520 RepID=A0AAE2UXR3_CLOBE|nr:substrate-binding domain-containing protein [Clostridium beijerinckii]ABR36572.1 periplasmic binding protein/LacI transcriptional regulator [Clostridium beijerinckii NCIMB 8052]AIU03050.1 periplasmic binding protein/LacI transcriptional regulator [Clostridium beijerinckii ATCC 35702]MBF7808780.1 substrate-binding domain-containing protein [Clostridium beijerinckii]NRT22359.1 ribose transport system substrate-binding protein [Clostridium beijerinckii]NRT65128.1 ribose transport system substr